MGIAGVGWTGTHLFHGARGGAKAMRLQELWIANGRFLSACSESDAPSESRAERLHRLGHVRIAVDDGGTRVEWCAFAPNWASLQAAIEWIGVSPGPFRLRYFLAGWFDESHASAAAARRRIESVMAKSDLSLSRRTFVRQCLPRLGLTPELLCEAWRDGIASPDHSVDCVLDEAAGHFRVERIGALSTIARLWGTTPASYPCINGGAYDRIVGDAYGEVVRSHRARFDHVYSAMSLHEPEQIWIPYQRVVLPLRVPGGRKAVSVVTAIAPVDIQIV
jgi:hypothetical protein